MRVSGYSPGPRVPPLIVRLTFWLPPLTRVKLDGETLTDPSPDGRTPFDRMTAAGYRYSTAAENIAAGQRTPQDVMTAWMNSPGHRANILNCALRQIGVGYATGSSSQYGVYWTQDFGTPR